MKHSSLQVGGILCYPWGEGWWHLTMVCHGKLYKTAQSCTQPPIQTLLTVTSSEDCRHAGFKPQECNGIQVSSKHTINEQLTPDVFATSQSRDSTIAVQGLQVQLRTARSCTWGIAAFGGSWRTHCVIICHPAITPLLCQKHLHCTTRSSMQNHTGRRQTSA